MCVESNVGSRHHIHTSNMLLHSISWKECIQFSWECWVCWFSISHYKSGTSQRFKANLWRNMIDERRLLVLCFPGGLLCICYVHYHILKTTLFESIHFCTDSWKLTFWNQLHLGSISPPLLESMRYQGRCSISLVALMFLENVKLFPLEFTPATTWMSDTMIQNKTCPLSHFKDSCLKCYSTRL